MRCHKWSQNDRYGIPQTQKNTFQFKMHYVFACHLAWVTRLKNFKRIIKELVKGNVVARKLSTKWQVKFVSNWNFEKLLVKLKHVLSNWTERTSNVSDSKEFAGNQGKHQNWVLSILSHNLWPIFIGMKHYLFIYFF